MPTAIEIILYSVISLAVLVYITKGIYTIIDRRKHPSKYEKKDEDRKAKLDE